MAFKKYIPKILGVLGEVKESTTSLTDIRTYELSNAHEKVMGVFPRESKYLHDQKVKI